MTASIQPRRRSTCRRLDGRGRIDLASLRGRKPIVLDFWASWCVPCIQESKRLEAAQKEYGDRIAFIGVDTKDFSGDARQWQRKHGITYPSVHDGSGSVLTSGGPADPAHLLRRAQRQGRR